jgi:hypothetical protein
MERAAMSADPTTLRIIAAFVGTALYCAGCFVLCWYATTRNAPGTEGDGLGVEQDREAVEHGGGL